VLLGFIQREGGGWGVGRFCSLIVTPPITIPEFPKLNRACVIDVITVYLFHILNRIPLYKWRKDSVL